MAKVVKLQTATVPAKVAKVAKVTKSERRNQTLALRGIAGVALTLTALSLTHLTCGIAQVTGGNMFESGAMAIGIDAGFVALEIAQIVPMDEKTAKTVKRFAQPAIIGTMLASAALNAFGFAAHASGLMVYPAVALGCAIPGLIYALTRVAVAMAK